MQFYFAVVHKPWTRAVEHLMRIEQLEKDVGAAFPAREGVQVALRLK